MDSLLGSSTRNHQISRVGGDDSSVSSRGNAYVCSWVFLKADWGAAIRPLGSRFQPTQNVQGPPLELLYFLMKPLWFASPLVDPDIEADKTTLPFGLPQHRTPPQ